MITREKLNHHISHLRAKHDRIDDQIATMERSGKFDDLEITRLKKEKLHLKDEIEKSKTQLEELA